MSRKTLRATVGAGMAGLSISAASARPDLAGLHLSGFGMVRDSVSVALEAAATHLGREADYERVYLLSGNAFAPAIATSESCRSWWHVQAHAGVGNLPVLAAALGLRAEPLVLPARPAAEDRSPPGRRHLFARQRQAPWTGRRSPAAQGGAAVCETVGFRKVIQSVGICKLCGPSCPE